MRFQLSATACVRIFHQMTVLDRLDSAALWAVSTAVRQNVMHSRPIQGHLLVLMDSDLEQTLWSLAAALSTASSVTPTSPLTKRNIFQINNATITCRMYTRDPKRRNRAPGLQGHWARAGWAHCPAQRAAESGKRPLRRPPCQSMTPCHALTKTSAKPLASSALPLDSPPRHIPPSLFPSPTFFA